MKVLDRYVMRELITPIFFCSVSLVVLILIADVFDNLDEFIRFKTPIEVICRYYLSLVPYAFVQTISWAAWLGTLFLLVNFGFHNELLAMKVAGLKITSIIRPIVFIGFLLGILTFMVSDRLVPWSYRVADELSEVYIEKKAMAHESKLIENITFHSPQNQLYYFRNLSVESGESKDIVILWMDTEGKRTKQKIAAQKGHWVNGRWEFEGVTEHQIDSRGKILGEPHIFPNKVYEDLTASPVDLSNASRDSVFLTYREMKSATRKLSATGVDVQSEEVDLQFRLASPWQSLVMMMIVIPLLGPTRTRRTIAGWVLGCVGLVFAFHLTGAVGLALGKSGILLPFLSAWAGNILFSAGTLLQLDKANF